MIASTSTLKVLPGCLIAIVGRLFTFLRRVPGVLEAVDDFHSSDDIYEAIGEMLVEVADGQSEDEIKWVIY